MSPWALESTQEKEYDNTHGQSNFLHQTAPHQNFADHRCIEYWSTFERRCSSWMLNWTIGQV